MQVFQDKNIVLLAYANPKIVSPKYILLENPLISSPFLPS